MLAAVFAALVLSACSNREATVNKRPQSGSATASMVNGVQQVILRSGVDLRFHPSTITVHPGKVRVILMNTAKPGAGPPHNVQAPKLPGLTIPLIPAGGSGEAVFNAPSPGRYSFVCTIHAAQGQYGLLIVKPLSEKP